MFNWLIRRFARVVASHGMDQITLITQHAVDQIIHNYSKTEWAGGRSANEIKSTQLKRNPM